jgi:2-iminobutanoate/2-iminopropanoate deaminase
MKKEIYTDQAPGAVGPYSQAVRTGNLLFTSGQVALDPSTGKLIKGDIKAQVRRVMENLGAVLNAGGTDFSRVIKATIFLKNINDFSEVNEVYGSYFSSAPPARSAIQVAALPLDASVEIEMIAEVEG